VANITSDLETLNDLVNLRRSMPFLQSEDTNTLLGRLRSFLDNETYSEYLAWSEDQKMIDVLDIKGFEDKVLPNISKRLNY
jgi:hypothetical protein